MAGLGATQGAVQCVVEEDKQHADHLVALLGVEVMRIGEQPEAANEVGRGAGDGDVEQRAGWPRQIEVDERRGTRPRDWVWHSCWSLDRDHILIAEIIDGRLDLTFDEGRHCSLYQA